MTDAVLLLGGAYLTGSLPTGYWLGKAWKGIDVRRHGSGNVGATNVFRVLGMGPGLATLAVDILKGWIPVAVCQRLFPNSLPLAVATGLTTIMGHTASVFVRLKGGKGVATSAGVFAALLPLPFVASLVTFAISFAITRYVSLSSMLAAITLAAGAFTLSSPRPLAWAAAAVAGFVLWTHRSNIQRLRRGTEHRIEFKRTSV